MQVGVRELKTSLSRYLGRVRDGEVIDVSDRGVLVARLIPARDSEPAVPPALAELLAAGKVSWSGRRFSPSARRTGLRGLGPTLADIVSENRE